jgi:hypothetical protein
MSDGVDSPVAASVTEHPRGHLDGSCRIETDVRRRLR